MVTAARERDATLVARSLVDPRAFTEIFDRHWVEIAAFCASRAGSAGEDVAAEAFRIAFDRRARFADRTGAGIRPWLYGIATNLLRHHFRDAERGARAHRRSGGRHVPDVADDALGRLEAERLGPQLARALGELPAGERDALLLLAWAGLEYEEIAQALDVPLGTVRSRIHRARGRVQAQLALEDQA
jgi:RNA polymerase sigma-70 factor (ECF subfamily)